MTLRAEVDERPVYGEPAIITIVINGWQHKVAGYPWAIEHNARETAKLIAERINECLRFT